VPAAVDSIVALLGPQTAIVTAVNGIPYWYFHRQGSVLDGATLESIDPGGRQMKLLGPERAIGCVLNPAADLIAPGLIRHVHAASFRSASPVESEPGGSSGCTRPCRKRDWRRRSEPTSGRDLAEAVGNLCLSPISALTCATLDLVATDPGTRAVCLAMMAEGRQLAEKIGVNLRVDADRRLDGAAAIGPHKISMLVDLETGRPMEIDPIVTVVQEIGSGWRFQRRRLTSLPR